MGFFKKDEDKNFEDVLGDYERIISQGNLELDKMNVDYAKDCYNKADVLLSRLQSLADLNNYKHVIFLASKGVVSEEQLLEILIKRSK